MSESGAKSPDGGAEVEKERDASRIMMAELFEANATDGLLNFNQIPEIIRKSYIVISDSFLDKLIRDARQENEEVGGIEWAQFEQIYETARAKQPTEEILTNALKILEEQKIFDNGEIGRMIPTEKMAEFLMTFGDVLTEEEAKEFTSDFDHGKTGEMFPEAIIYNLISGPD